jgi:hypothetical protein
MLSFLSAHGMHCGALMAFRMAALLARADEVIE